MECLKNVTAVLLKKILFILVLFGFNWVHGQTDTLTPSFSVVDQVLLKGNKTTKDKIILRELSFGSGDTLRAVDMAAFFKSESNKIFNTDLFVTADVVSKPSAKGLPFIDVEVLVRERWYIYPVPIFELADRSFNEWWTNQNRSLKRLEYGFVFSHDNFRGRKEKLGILLKFGFTPKIELAYTIPYINKKQTSGLSFKFHHSINKTVNYQSDANKLSNYKSESRLRERWYGAVSFSHRPNFYVTHTAELKFHDISLHDSVAILNPDYFGGGQTRQRFMEFYYTFSYDRRDRKYYPLKGTFARVIAQQIGLGIFDDLRLSSLKLEIGKYSPLGKGFFYATRNVFRTSYPQFQPYLITNGLGWGQEYVRGYDLYVIESQHHFLSRNSLRKQVFSKVFHFNSFLKADQFNTIPLSIYANAFSDVGYVSNKNIPTRNGRLADTPLWGYGFGIDLVSSYDFAIRFEYVFTKHKENGFFINVEAGL